jgi:hypothetical protein
MKIHVVFAGFLSHVYAKTSLAVTVDPVLSGDAVYIHK